MKHTTERVSGNGLMLHVHRFEPDDISAERGHVLLLHGFMDAGGTWAAVAEPLCTRGLSVLAPDFRGFGRSDRVSGGGYYHFADYVADIHALVTELELTDVTVVGHSMGGTVACYFAAQNPALRALVLLEGVGPPDMSPSLGPTRMRTWLAQLQRPKRQSPLANLDAAVSRLAINHPTVARERLQEVAQHLTVNTDGELRWAFDPLHRTTSPTLFRADGMEAFLREITCPVLFVSGGASGWHPPGEAERLATLPSPPKQVVLPDAGHMMHWTCPAEVAGAISTFIADDTGD